MLMAQYIVLFDLNHSVYINMYNEVELKKCSKPRHSRSKTWKIFVNVLNIRKRLLTMLMFPPITVSHYLNKIYENKSYNKF